eukprot:TRINITY_DN3709_c0_g3_i1.p1 TRINITY_DN3709_c0_g3~~TRINITY_DN3709_c0_g3_i1.p1  ORF type:complete len:379 (+),score=154.67 TRINITY_DN3709_c0_g3_i1:972-2108(+)
MMICKQTAQAVNWMHNLSPPVLHLDLKPANLLLDKHFNVKVADFGLSMLKVQNLEVANGSPYFMCPEMFEKKEITEKADVYSFGILIWEIMTEGVPYSENPRIRDIESLKSEVIKGVRPDSSKLGIPRLKELFIKCVHPDPKSRPTFRMLLDRMEFDHCLVEGLISPQNQLARLIWIGDFFGKYLVPWEDFKKSFCKYLKIINLDESNLKIIFFKKVLGAISNLNLQVENSKEFVSLQNFANCFECFGPITTGTELLENIDAVVSQPYFHGNISKENADTLLRRCNEGSYLVRFSSSSPGIFTLSFLLNKKVSHMRIQHEVGGNFRLQLKSGPLEGSTLKKLLSKYGPLRRPVQGSEFQIMKEAHRRRIITDSTYSKP